MLPMSRFVAWCAVVGLAACGSPLAAQTTIRDADGDKRVLFVDGDDIRPEPGGKRLLFIDGDDIRPEPGGKRLLFVDGDDVRPTPGGVRIAFIDGEEIRRRPGGAILLHYSHPDIRPKAGGPRLFFVDGERLTIPQLVAVIYQLRPAVLKLSDKETADLKAEMAANAAAEEARAKADNVPGRYELVTFNSSDDTKRDGDMTVAKHGKYYKLAMNFKDGTKWEGAAAKVGDEVWAAIGPEKTAALGLYEVKPTGELDGLWVPAYLLGTDEPVFGIEKLQSSNKKGTDFKITEAKAPTTGDAYAGTLKATPTKVQLNGNGGTAALLWTMGTVKVHGVGLRAGNILGACAAGSKEFAIVRFKTEGDNLIGDFLSNTGVNGFYTYVKYNE